MVGLDKDGKSVEGTDEADIAKITKFVIQATFKEDKVAAVSHTATVKFKNKKGIPPLFPTGIPFFVS